MTYTSLYDNLPDRQKTQTTDIPVLSAVTQCL